MLRLYVIDKILNIYQLFHYNFLGHIQFHSQLDRQGLVDFHVSPFMDSFDSEQFNSRKTSWIITSSLF